MAEKRSDYRKRTTSKKRKKVLSKVRSAFADEPEDVNVNQDFIRDDNDAALKRESNRGEVRQKVQTENEQDAVDSDKSLRLKKRLNHAIIVEIILLVLVLLALFHL